ncbi:Phosphoribosylformylglycinamidine synthase, PurQ subunit (FGAM synthase I) [Nitrospina gracilis 3/211]|uniref:Phosphoribosylformylglycinamidine synthase subunit PurQ n=1 Tax=Nitrospina gracilis (strain 3/211) TaxID=1266370 RepID=M1ZEA7_NITG3|nr:MULTISPECIES: phosphoribosylformylglycinamidine synthase subunit PurQ [Nitrospina]MCF8722463.1 phosphoribosylformylglycinamidine synthase [Nitrospina sp. Nb-3]CCQ91889.1 Phosphoribosylformylglycinamidine synthase, PurQ subunit (FGAM synthase I) [Nitrospina gracilis 3/211]
MNCGVVTFPGSNCDRDCFHILKNVYGADTTRVWHKDTSLDGFDLVVLPGGFSYGDYLRAGSIARFSPIMKAVVEYADKGGLLWGICNGFQILVEAGLLPGALLDNRTQKYMCRYVHLKVENVDTPFTRACESGEVLNIPIAHAQGSYYADADTMKKLEDTGRIVFRYCDAQGNVTEEANPNGSLANIAGIVNDAGNVLGMMPHPERCADPVWPQIDGQKLFDSLFHKTGVRA